MKLPIKKKCFDQIKSGKKKIEYRDAHITFVCEETGETIRKDISRIELHCKDILKLDGLSDQEISEMFEDKTIVAFHLK